MQDVQLSPTFTPKPHIDTGLPAFAQVPWKKYKHISSSDGFPSTLTGETKKYA